MIGARTSAVSKTVSSVVASLGIVAMTARGVAQQPLPTAASLPAASGSTLPSPPTTGVASPPPSPGASTHTTYYSIDAMPADSSGPTKYYSPNTLPSGPLSSAAGFHLHDGIYLRVSLGLGTQAVATKNSSLAGVNNASGIAGCLDLAIGGTVARGLVIGGALMSQTVDKPKVKTIDGEEKAVGVASVSFVGAMMDVFPNPEAGLHIGAALGPALVQVPESPVSRKSSGSGLGGAAWIGVAGWVSSEWSVGGLARLSAVSAKGSQDIDAATTTDRHTALSLCLLLTALYH